MYRLHSSLGPRSDCASCLTDSARRPLRSNELRVLKSEPSDCGPSDELNAHLRHGRRNYTSEVGIGGDDDEMPL
jgi:hypothetical protein